MSRVLPHPLLSLALLLMWLMLTRFSLGHALLGGTVAVFAGWSMSALQPETPRFRRWDRIPRLLWLVWWDILLSNLAVTRLILTRGRSGRYHSAFVEIPLELRDRTGLAWLAVIITVTPGTTWIRYDGKRDMLTIHAIGVTDPAANRDLIKARYEALLLEIFE